MNEWLSRTMTGALWFPPEWSKAALMLALLSTCVLATLFVYLNRTTRRPYFQLWIVAWLFYAVHLAAAIGLQESPAVPWLGMVRLTCLGLSALFMFWGGFSLAGRARKLRELGLATALVVLWSYLAASRVQTMLWITVPMFALLAAGGVYTGGLYLARRQFSRGARILGVGFLLWGAQLAFFPFLDRAPMLLAVGHVLTAALTMLIAVGMLVEHQVMVAEQHYRTLFDAAGDALLLVDATTGRVLEANVAAQALVGTSQGLVGQPVANIYREWGGLADGTGGPRQTQSIPSGRMVDLHTSPITCPRGPAWLVSARDVTERHRLEQFWRATAWELQETVAELRQVRQQESQQEPSNALADRFA